MANGTIDRLEQNDDVVTAVEQILSQTTGHSIDAVGHRVVHGGDSFNDAVIVTDNVIAEIEKWSSLAPLHNPNAIKGILAAQKHLPKLQHIAVFDTAFHNSLPRRSSTYALDTQIADKYTIKRYGFHGPSHHYVALQAAEYLQQPLNQLRIVSLHLGNGASACAIENGHSTDTSMGMTPMEGLVMGTRVGDIDGGVITHLIRQGYETAEELEELLNKSGGLKGLSGVSNDLRDIEDAAASGNDRARLAIAVFAHRAKKYIGAYAAALGGMDTVILTGGIGENSATIRQRILQRLDFLGITIDEDKNLDAQVSSDKPVAAISSSRSRVQVLVVKTNEELMIAQQSAALISQNRPHVAPNPSGIPIAISGRHIHLDKETFATLFGEHTSPTPYKALSQPGQYACEEKVNLIGPRNRINSVRLLGPLRQKNQVEISRTDEFTLGVDAPVRDSGRVQNSAPITVEGPMGTVHLEEGLICARRHIHMHPDDAERYGVKTSDEVEVAITAGERDLIFGDVKVRVSPNYRLEMHIDTDEANAAELSGITMGDMVYTGVDFANAEIRAKKTF